jgi:outer membrane protein TolC
MIKTNELIMTTRCTIATVLLAVAFTATQAQPLTIDNCYALATKNYPLVKKQDLITRTAGYSLKNAAAVFLPQATINGQAGYQSETLNFAAVFPSSAGRVPEISKDQYKIQAEISQVIYDGGTAKNQRALIRANEQVQEQSLAVSLNTLKDRVNQIFFSILLIDEQLKQNEIRRTDLLGALDKARAAWENGTALRSNMDELQAEIINVDMKQLEGSSARSAFCRMLSLLIGQEVSDNTQLALPSQPTLTSSINRPELRQYELQKKTYDLQAHQLKSDLRPRLSAFLLGAYGRPTLNFIENKFGPWWMGGVRLNWSLGNIYNLKNNRSLININRQHIAIEQEVFLFNTRLTMEQENGEIKKFAGLLEKDDTLIKLRARVVQSAKAQWDNGVITVHEYINKGNEENMARQNRILHQIQLLQAQFNYATTAGK